MDIKKYKFRNRRTVLVSFSLLFAIVVALGIFTASSVTSLNNLFREARDKFLPAIEVSLITEKLYANRLSLEEHILEKDSLTLPKIEGLIFLNNKQIDSLIIQYSDIYSSPVTSNNLQKYRNQIQEYRNLETLIIKQSRRGSKQQALLNFIGRSSRIFQGMIKPMEKLINIHTTEGQELYKKSEDLAGQIRFYLYLAVGLAFAIAIIVGTIVGFTYMNE